MGGGRAIQWVVTAALALAGVLSAKPVAAGPTLPLERCRVEGLETEARCGTYAVFEDREARAGRRIALKVVVLPATGPDREPDPLVPIAGGPGDSVTRTAAMQAVLQKELNRRRDIVLIDVRGSGSSGALDCAHEKGGGPFGLLEQFLPAPAVARCRAALTASADLRLYTTPQIVDDLAEVLAALGYEKVNLLGASYGTRAAQVFMRRHPRMVRTATLHGTVLIDARMPLSFARDAQDALEGLFGECAAQPRCAAAFPDLRGDLRRALGRLEKEPIEVSLPDSSGAPVRAGLSRVAFIQALRYMMYLPATAGDIPRALHSAASGDFQVMATTAALFGRLLEQAAEGLYLSVTCSEDVPRIPDGEIAPAVAGTFLGDYRILKQREACAGWPRAELPAGYWEPLRSDTPVLLLTGERDPATPPRWAREVARTLPRSLVAIVPHGGHDFEGLEGTGCLDTLVTAFVESGEGSKLDVEGCLAGIRRPPFDTKAPRAVVELTPGQLARCAGRYRSEEAPLSMTIELLDGVLRLRMPGREESYRLEPLAEDEFQIAGAPPGYGLRFQPGDGPFPSVLMLQPGQEPLRLLRQPGE